ncbi:MAG: hypothetical protein HY904_18610 [Deltaproteobacteria bacterium]|nr:hypothetical protein [Deltaproteobacteria bacterium]
MRHLIPALLLAAAPAAAAEGAPPRVLVVPYRVDPAIPVESATADAILTARLTKVKTLSIISQDELNRLGNYQAMLQGLGQDDVEGLRRLGEAAEAQLLVAGTLGDVGGTTTASLVLLDVRTGEVTQRFAGTARGGRDLVIPLITGQADGMLAHLLRTYAPARLRSRAPAPRDAGTRPARAVSVPSVASMALLGAGALVAGIGLGGAAASAAAGTAGLVLYTRREPPPGGGRTPNPLDPAGGELGFLTLGGVAVAAVLVGMVVALCGAAMAAGGVAVRAVVDP